MTDNPAIPAATLIVVRECPADKRLELLVVERAAGMAFAGGALVFPGGRIDAADRDLAAELGADAGAVAAIRETVEETAIPVAIEPIPSPGEALAMQQALAAESKLVDVALGRSLRPDRLVPFARWVPQFHAVRRFDTMFYLAEAPPGDWTPTALAGECTGAFWMTADEALDRDRRGEAQLIFPTRRNLERLARHASFAAMIEDARNHPIEAISPWLEEVNGERFVTIPDHLGYPVIREKLEGLWRG